MTSLLKNAFIFLGLVGIAGLGYFLFIQNGVLSTNDSSLVESQAAAETEIFLQRLNELKVIKLDRSIFVDPRFVNLNDHSTQNIVVPVGRSNPF